jgi:DNA-binding CsgD family transcriptional regulator
LTAIDSLIASAPNGAGPRSLPWLALARGDALMLLDRFEEAESAYDAARVGAVVCGFAHLSWRAERALAQLWRGVGRVADAEGALDRALTAVREIAETIAAADERAAYLSRVDVTFPADRTLPAVTAVPGGLSPREVEVLRLVAQGLTDAQVGERLAISRRTVGRHLESVYNKLGVGSRTAAVAFAFEHDLVGDSRSV